MGIWTLNPFEGTPENNPILWIIQKANIQQLHLINRAYRATKANYDLIIDFPKLSVIQEYESQAQRDVEYILPFHRLYVSFYAI